MSESGSSPRSPSREKTKNYKIFVTNLVGTVNQWRQIGSIKRTLNRID